MSYSIASDPIPVVPPMMCQFLEAPIDLALSACATWRGCSSFLPWRHHADSTMLRSGGFSEWMLGERFGEETNPQALDKEKFSNWSNMHMAWRISFCHLREVEAFFS